jgi:hypothetical protein
VRESPTLCFQIKRKTVFNTFFLPKWNKIHFHIDSELGNSAIDDDDDIDDLFRIMKLLINK